MLRKKPSRNELGPYVNPTVSARDAKISHPILLVPGGGNIGQATYAIEFAVAVNETNR